MCQNLSSQRHSIRSVFHLASPLRGGRDWPRRAAPRALRAGAAMGAARRRPTFSLVILAAQISLVMYVMVVMIVMNVTDVTDVTDQITVTVGPAAPDLPGMERQHTTQQAGWLGCKYYTQWRALRNRGIKKLCHGV
jgi:hypothetical protein